MDFLLANEILFILALVFSLIASYFDLKTGEIPDKFTIGLFSLAILLRAVFAFQMGDPDYLIDGAAVGGIFFTFGALLFYTGGWGGGDAKLIAGIGACLGGLMSPSIVQGIIIFPDFFGFFASLSIAAIPYSLTYAFILSLRTPKVFSLTRERLKESWLALSLAAIVSLSLFLLMGTGTALISLIIISPVLLFVLTVFVRCVEELAMQKEVDLRSLAEGDMVVEDLVAGGKTIISKRNMDGISKEALEELRAMDNAPEKIRIKWGIRFGPAFPLALLISPFWGALLLAVI